MALLLEDKVAILVGCGASGATMSNGRATALEFIRQGAQLVLADRDEQALAECVAAIEAEGGSARAIQVDATNEDQVNGLFDTVMADYGRVDILHNSLGITSFGRLSRAPTEDFDRVVTVNLKALFFLCRAALVAMEKNGSGVITNISSVSSIRHLGIRSPLYDMSKAGLNALTRSIAVDYGPMGIRANSILVGMMDTPLARNGIATANRTPDEVYEGYIQQIPLSRMGLGTDTASLAVFLASDNATYITGSEIVVDGGLTLRSS